VGQFGEAGATYVVADEGVPVDVGEPLERHSNGFVLVVRLD